MKAKLLLLSFLFISFNLLAQQNVWTGTIDDKWSNKDNWSGDVPISTDDVLIMSGFTVTIDMPANIRSIEVQGNSILNVTSNLIIANPSNFESNVIVNWSSGDLTGGGILLNSGTINLSFNSFDLSGSTVLNNPGTINLIGGANLSIGTDSVLNNSGTGTIDFKSNGTTVSRSGVAPNALINDGLIKTSFTNDLDNGFIGSQLINRSGVIQVEKGSLNINNTTVSLESGQYNVSAGATLNFNSPMTLIGTLSGNVFGDLNFNNNISIAPASTAVFNFLGNTIVKWISGDLEGGGTLTNLSIIDRSGAGSDFISDASVLNNSGEIRFTGIGDFLMRTGAIINNNTNGILDFTATGSDINITGAEPHLLNNLGIIKTSFANTTDQSTIRAQLINNQGTIQVEAGTISLSNANSILTDATINVSFGAKLEWILPLTISGNLNGTLNGTFDWKNTLLVPTSASLNFTGIGKINWTEEDLDGGGILTNLSFIEKSGLNANIIGSTTLNNQGLISFAGSGDILIGTGSILNNNASGIIDLNFNGAGIGVNGAAPNALNNFGLIKGNVPSGSANIAAQANNSGIIEIAQNTLVFSGTLNNQTAGIIKGIGTIDLPIPVNFTNNGTFAPGASPGSLTIIGDYSTSSSSQLEVELDGETQSVDYDLLNIQGNASFEGDIQIVLGFDAAVNNEFIIATTTGTISNCSLPATKTANFNGSQYEFNITCRNNNELVLTVNNKTLGLESIENSLSKISLFPNPAIHKITFSDDIIKKINIYDLNGRNVLNSSGNSISVKTLSKGIYIVKGTTSENISISKKLIKN